MTINTSSPAFYLHLLITLLVLLLPGVAICLAALAARRRTSRRVDLELLLAAPALSISFWPLLLLYLTLLGVRLTPQLAWGVTAVTGLVAILLGWRLFGPKKGTNAGPAIRPPGAMPGTVTLLALTVVALAYRLGDIDGLMVPMFGDSVHHTLITQMILEGGFVPSGYQPYVPVDTFTYHFGFHTLAAVVAWLSGTGAPYSVLLVGQVLIAASIPLAYLLNKTLFGSRLAGLGAALSTGFISIMPAYYVNWGRYTQLAGQVLLVGALVFLVRLLSPARTRSDIVLTALCVAGLVVVHYRVLIFFGLFALAFGAWQLIMRRTRLREVMTGWGSGFGAVFLGLFGSGPWLLNLVENYFPRLLGRLATVTPEYLQDYNNPSAIEKFAGRLLPALALGAIVLVLAQLAHRRVRRSGAALPAVVRETGLHAQIACLALALWVSLLVGSLWVVPGAIGGYTVAISLYIPLAALAGYGISWLAGQGSRLLKISPALFGAAMFFVAPLAANTLGTAHVIDQGTFGYVHPPDIRAFAWIRANTPQDSTFLISSQFTYVGRGVTASDAGMWISLLTGRQASLPALSTWMERPVEVGYFERARLLAAYTQRLSAPGGGDTPTQDQLVALGILDGLTPLSSPTALEAMKSGGITHIYVGAREGHSTPRIDLAALNSDLAHFRPVYDEGGVYIFEVRY